MPQRDQGGGGITLLTELGSGSVPPALNVGVIDSGLGGNAACDVDSEFVDR